jgi:molybdopterin synthase sulfur carrier subunit
MAEPVTIKLPALLVDLFPGAPRETQIEAATVDDLMSGLDTRWPGMRDRICDSRPAIRRHINVFVDGRRVKLDHPLAPGAVVYVLTAISGG